MRPHILSGLSLLALVAACNGGSTGGGEPAAETPPPHHEATAEAPQAGRDHAATEAPQVGQETAAAETAPAPAGKPSAPVDIDYEVIGTPIVGQPVSIDLSVKSTRGDAPVRLTYRVLDAQSMSFPDTQSREMALRVGDTQPAVRQVTVVPQREGRLYLNVTAEVETDSGTLIKAIAIPVQVGSGPAEREPNGTLKEDAEGDPVISLPADET